tara:strand:- start:486 stop:1463 length:978 start_codon:yes stop_codon:yes gene_type:complete
MKFIDYAKISVKSGNGGNGCIAFLREKFRPKGGPSGGDGGRGGHVIFKSDSKLSTLQDFSYKRKYIASSGEHGKGKNMHGKNGDDINLLVPIGTIIKNLKDNSIIADMDKDNMEVVIANGGNGGFGNARFKTQKNTSPRIANDGQKGEEIELELELKILADVGLVGFPNAGKSTYISNISNAKPKIADYPFTTLVPNLGIVKTQNYNTFVIADIPGLIHGASLGKGLGIQFLKHIERTKILVFIIDSTTEDVVSEYETLCSELKAYNELLLSKPKLLLLSKIDLLENNKYNNSIPNIDKIIQISSISNVGLGESKNAIFECLSKI